MLQPKEILDIIIPLWLACTSLFYVTAHLFGFIKFVKPWAKEDMGFMEAINRYKTEGTQREFVEAFSKQKPNKFMGK